MKKFLLTLCCILTSALSYAYDFENNGICYNVTSVSDRTVEVTYKAWYMPTPTENTDYYKGDIVIPSSVEYNGITYKVTSVGRYAFARATHMSSIEFPNTLITIGDGAFYMASSLQNIVIPESVTSIGEGAFMYCEKLKTYEMPQNLSSYSDSQFSYCTGLEDIRINSNVSVLGYCCFQGCSNIKKVYFDSNIRFDSFNNYGYLTFKDCPNITSVYCNGRNPYSFSNMNVFDSYVYLNSTLYIPRGATQIYRATAGWKEFVNIVETDNFEDQSGYYSFNFRTTAGGIVSVFGESLSNTTMSAFVYSGEDITLSFTPEDGHELKSVVVNGVDVTKDVVDNSYTIQSVSQNTTVEVVFAELPVYLTIKSDENGAFTQEIEKGKEYTFTLANGEGWEIGSIYFNGIDVTSSIIDNKYTTPKISQNSELSVVYKTSPFKTTIASLKEDNDNLRKSLDEKIAEIALYAAGDLNRDNVVDVNDLEYLLKSSSYTGSISDIANLVSENTSLSEIQNELPNAEFYKLDGTKVAQPDESGIYLIKNNGKTVKIVIKK